MKLADTKQDAPVAQLDRALASGASSRVPHCSIFNVFAVLLGTVMAGVVIYYGG